MLAEGRWLHEHMNLILCGPTVVGKTYVASALGHAACQPSFGVRYYRVSRLVGDPTIAKADGSYPRLMRALAKTDLLVLDDWGLAPLTTSEARELLEVIDDRCNRRSTLVASQLPVDTWHSAIRTRRLQTCSWIASSIQRIVSCSRGSRCASSGRSDGPTTRRRRGGRSESGSLT